MPGCFGGLLCNTGECRECRTNEDCGNLGLRCSDAGTCISAGQAGDECWQKNDCDQSSQNMTCAGGSLFGIKFRKGVCTIDSCREEGAGCNFHLDCCENLFCTSSLLSGSAASVSGKTSGVCQRPPRRVETLQSLADPWQ